MKIKMCADFMTGDMKRVKMVGKVFTVKKKKIVTRTVGYFFDYKGKTIFAPKGFVEIVKV